MCPSLENPGNGDVFFSDRRLPGSFAIYICDEGFLVSSNREQTIILICEGDMWSLDAQTCECKIASLPIPQALSNQFGRLRIRFDGFLLLEMELGLLVFYGNVVEFMILVNTINYTLR